MDKQKEAFDRADFLYNEWIDKTIPNISETIIKQWDDFAAYDTFKKAVLLQLAALNLLSGKNFQKPQTYPMALACFVIDHILTGFNASTKGDLRIAFTLSRPAIEAAIFEIASALIPEIFQKQWNTKNGTGGYMLKKLKNHPNLSSKIYSSLYHAWKSSAPFAHPSLFPLMSSQEKLKNDTIGMSFAGQHLGSLNAQHLLLLFNLYTDASLIGVDAINIALVPSIEDNDLWIKKYKEFISIVEKPMPVPKHLRQIYNEFKQRNII